METDNVLDDPGYRAAVTDLLGFISTGQLATFARLAKDATHSPDVSGRVTLSYMAARAAETLASLEEISASLEGDLYAAMESYTDAFATFDPRTTPSNWWERILKTYVGYGIFGDLQRQIASELPDDFATELNAVLDGEGFEEWVIGLLTPVHEADEQLKARQALWGRRVAGDAIGICQTILDSHPNLKTWERDGEKTVMQRVSLGHARRMGKLGLVS